jgi:integrase
MATQNLLNNLTVKKATCPKGKLHQDYTDGGNLFYRIYADGRRNWIVRLYRDKKEHVRGVGSYPTVSLAQARQIRDDYKVMWAKGLDPKTEKVIAKHTIINQTELTFDKAYQETLNKLIIPVSSDGHIKRWKEAYNKYLKNSLGTIPLTKIDDALLLSVLLKVHANAPSSAEKIKSQINVIFRHMKEKKWFRGANPVRELDGNSLLKPPKAKHYTPLDPNLMGDFNKYLKAHDNLIISTLLYVITVTALRTSSARKSTWSMLDTKTNTLNVPMENMKGRVSFRCPIPKQAMVKLMTLRKFTGGKNKDYIFEGARQGKPLSDATARNNLQKFTGDKTHVHGFRTLYSQIATKMKKNGVARFTEERIESQITHAYAKTKMRQLYLGNEDFLDERRELVQAYADWCDKQ